MKNTDFEKSVKTYERQDPHEVALYQFELTLNDVIKRFKENRFRKNRIKSYLYRITKKTSLKMPKNL